MVAALRRARAVGGQFQYRLFTGQLRSPVGQLTVALAGFHPLPLPYGIVDVLHCQGVQLGRAAFTLGGIQLDQLIDHDLHGPEIRDDVVLGQGQHMLAVAEAKQADPDQWPLLQIEHLLVLGFDEGLDLLLARRCIGHLFQRRVLERQRLRRVDDLYRVVIDLGEGSAQGFVSGDQGVEAALQCRHVQCAL
ncbi:hypothetical protein D9M73_185190 [compost metagenome]